MNQSFSTSFTVDQSPMEVYDAINHVRGWWPDENEGRTDELGEFKHNHHDVHRCTIRITELVPGKKVVWHIVDNYFNFVEDNSEWNDTNIVFDIEQKGDKTEVRFTHAGLVPAFECYDSCSYWWSTYINSSLRDLIATGKG